jgi:hypothetical protein
MADQCVHGDAVPVLNPVLYRCRCCRMLVLHNAVPCPKHAPQPVTYIKRAQCTTVQQYQKIRLPPFPHISSAYTIILSESTTTSNRDGIYATVSTVILIESGMTYEA